MKVLFALLVVLLVAGCDRNPAPKLDPGEETEKLRQDLRSLQYLR